jgi:hypothetical protein
MSPREDHCPSLSLGSTTSAILLVVFGSARVRSRALQTGPDGPSPDTLILIEIRFIKFNLTSRVYQTKLSPLEGLARPRALPRSPPYGAVERSARAWSPALQTGPVLILQLRPSPRPRGWEGFLVHILVLDGDLGVEFGRHHCNVRSYFAH